MKKTKWVDGIIVGQPEETVFELVQSLSKDLNKWDFNCPGGVWRNPKNNLISKIKKRKIKLTLDKLPFPARDIEEEEKESYINLEASRGCNFKCSYCHVPLYQAQCEVEKRIVRTPKKIVDEIEYINKKLTKTFFIFNDSHFWSCEKDDNRILEFCKELKKRKLNIKFYIYLRCNPFPDEKIIKSLAEVGLVRIFLGIENASESSLKIYNKNIDLKTYPKIKKLLDKYSINVHIGHIVFQPYSTLKDINENIEYLNKIDKLFRVGVILEAVRIIPGSRLHKMLIKDGLLDKSESFDKLTYGYRYKIPEVGELFQGLKSMFFDVLQEKNYDTEYYCVSGDLLKTLVERTNFKKASLLKEDFNSFYKTRADYKKIMYVYLKKAIKIAENDGGKEKIANKRIHKKFIKDYKKASFDLQVVWGKMIESVRMKMGDKIINEMFRGIE